MRVERAELGGGVALVIAAAVCVAVLVYLLQLHDDPLGPPPPAPQYAPAAPPGTVTDATAFGPDNPFGVKTATDFLCRAPTPSPPVVEAVGAAAAPAPASAPFVSQSTCPGNTTSPGPPFGQSAQCPQPPIPATMAPAGTPPAKNAFSDTGYGYCTGVPGTSDSTLYRDWVAFYDDPARTGTTFPRDADRNYNRVGNVTGAGCLVDPDSGKTDANYSRGPYMQTLMLGDEPVLYDMLTRAYPAGPGAEPGTAGPQGNPKFPRLTPEPKRRTTAPTFGNCTDRTTGACAVGAATKCPGQTRCQTATPAEQAAAQRAQTVPGPPPKCLCVCDPPCGQEGLGGTINCDESCLVTAPVAEEPLAAATFAFDGGYGEHMTGVHKIWGWTPKFEMGGVSTSNVYPFKPANAQGPRSAANADGAEAIEPGNPMYNCHVLRHRLTGDFAPTVDPNADRDGALPPGVPIALDFNSAWVRPKGYEADDDAGYQAGRARCGECGAAGKECFAELSCKHFDSFDATRPLSIEHEGKTISTFYRNPPQLPVSAADNPPAAPAKQCARKSYSSGAGGPNPRARCGGCSATRQVFGPGRYTARARIVSTNPQSARLLDTTDPANPRGRGFVFAMWTFAYTEIYAIGSDPETNPDFVVSDQATTSAPCWDDCSCLTNTQNFCSKKPVGEQPDTCCDPRTARVLSADTCTTPQAFTPASAGTAALYKDPSAGQVTDNVATPATCALSPPTADPHTQQTWATEGGCYIANEDIDCWVGDPSNQTDPNDKDNCGVTFCSNKPNPKDPAAAGKVNPKGDWLNAGPCLKAVNTFEGGRSQPYAINAVSKDWDLKIQGRRPPHSPYTTVCSGYKVYTSINSEIDIEIPANSPQLDWTTHLNFNTMNANTWAFDIDSYQGYKPFYSQAMVQALKLPKQVPAADDAPPLGIPSDQPTFVDDRYHDYMIDWYVDQDHSKSYVAFYFDGRLVYSTQRFVPTRSGRLIWGLWPGWWGTGRQRPDFDFGYADLAGLIIEPYTQANAPDVKVRTMPQTYDQVLPANVDQTQCCSFSQERYDFKGATQCNNSTPCEMACDFQAIPASLQSKAPGKTYGCVDGVCRPLSAGGYQVAPGAPTYQADPYCGGACGTCVGCYLPAPMPAAPGTDLHRNRFVWTVVLYFGACLGVVAGALLLASARGRAKGGQIGRAQETARPT